MSPHRTLKTNILRNLRDQPLHFLWAFATTIAPIYGLSVDRELPYLTAILFLLASLSTAVIIIREAKQWPPHDDWDAPLDWSFYVLGAVGGVVSGLLLF